MPEAPKRPSYFFSIVVLGPMNPRLHHPYWYEQIGAISAAERLEALGGDVVVMPMIGKFDIPSAGIIVACAQDRWDIQTIVESSRDRVVEVASKVFEKLNETPVRAFGLNTHVHRPTTVPSIKARLMELLGKTGLGLPQSDPIAAHIMVKSKAADGHKVHIEVSQSPVGDSVVLVTFNTEYEPPILAGYFDLGAAIRERLGPHNAQATEIAAKVVDGLRV